MLMRRRVPNRPEGSIGTASSYATLRLQIPEAPRMIGNQEVAHVCGDERSNREANHVERAPGPRVEGAHECRGVRELVRRQTGRTVRGWGRIAGRRRSNQ